jgi:hypothetical protein
MTINQKRENLRQKLETHLTREGLKVVAWRDGGDTRSFEPLVRLIGGERTAQMSLEQRRCL